VIPDVDVKGAVRTEGQSVEVVISETRNSSVQSLCKCGSRDCSVGDLDLEGASEVSATLDPSDWLFGDSDATSGRQSAQSQRIESSSRVNHTIADVVT
jgi:hypothetical protein